MSEMNPLKSPEANLGFTQQILRHPRETLSALGASFLAAAAVAGYKSADAATAEPVVPPYPGQDEIKYTPEISASECMSTAVGRDPATLQIRQHNVRGKKTLMVEVYDQEVDDWFGGRGPGCDYVGKRALKGRVLIGDNQNRLRPAGPFRLLARGNQEVNRKFRLRVKKPYRCAPGKEDKRRIGFETFERGNYNGNTATNRARYVYRRKGENGGFRVKVC